MVYKEMYFNLADEVEKVICELFEMGEDCQAIGMCYRLIDKIEECEEMYYKQCKTSKEITDFPQKYNDLMRKSQQFYKDCLKKKGLFFLD